jgi:hypothetical protein
MKMDQKYESKISTRKKAWGQNIFASMLLS